MLFRLIKNQMNAHVLKVHAVLGKQWEYKVQGSIMKKGRTSHFINSLIL